MTYGAALLAEMQTFSSSFSKLVYHQFYTAQKYALVWNLCLYRRAEYKEATAGARVS